MKNMTSRGVPKPKNPTTLAAVEKSDDNSGSLLGVAGYQSNDPHVEQEPQIDKYYKPPTAVTSSGIGKGTASITDVKARQHQRLGITPAPAYPAASRSQPPITGYF